MNVLATAYSSLPNDQFCVFEEKKRLRFLLLRILRIALVGTANVEVVRVVLTGLLSSPTGRFAGGISAAVLAHLFSASFIIPSLTAFPEE